MDHPVSAAHGDGAPASAHTANAIDNTALEHSDTNRKFGFWLFVSSELLIFVGLIFSFAYTRLFAFRKGQEFIESIHWPESTLLSVAMVSINTFVLLFSSLAVVMAIQHARVSNTKGAVRWLVLVSILGTVFLAGQAFEYNLLINTDGQSLSTPFGGPFFVLTGLHGLHVLVGVIWCVITCIRAAQGTYSSKNYMSIEIFGLYWHFVDLVWVIIFTVIYLISDKTW